MSIRLTVVSLAAILFINCEFPDFSRAQAAQANAEASAANGEASIRKLIQDYVVARKTADPNKLQSLFTTDADQLVSTGEWRRGRVDLVRGTVESSRREKGERTIEVEAVRFIGPEVALVDARYDITGTQTPPRRMRTTVLCQQEDGVWRIAAIRNMLPAAP